MDDAVQIVPRKIGLRCPCEKEGAIVASRNSFKFAMLPPQTYTTGGWANSRPATIA